MTEFKHEGTIYLAVPEYQKCRGCVAAEDVNSEGYNRGELSNLCRTISGRDVRGNFCSETNAVYILPHQLDEYKAQVVAYKLTGEDA